MNGHAFGVLRTLLLAAAVAAAASGCGQRGPLVLPGDARPIERLPPQTGAPADTQDDDEDRQE